MNCVWITKFCFSFKRRYNKKVKKLKEKTMAKITLEKLALMVAGGFNEMGEKFKRVDARLDGIDIRLDGIDVRLYEIDSEIRHIIADMSEVKRDVAEIKENIIQPLEFEDLSHRVKYIERKLGIESGK